MFDRWYPKKDLWKQQQQRSLLSLLFRESSWGPRPLAALHCLHFCWSWFWEWFFLSQLYFLLRWRRQIITRDEKLGFYLQASESMPPMCNFKLCHLNRLMHAALRMNKGWRAFTRQGGLAQLGKNHCVVLVPLHRHQVKLHLFIPAFLLCIRLGLFLMMQGSGAIWTRTSCRSCARWSSADPPADAADAQS